MLEQGTILNDTYEILEELGSGGGGVVYKAYHRRLRHHVVVKKIKENIKGRIEGRAEADLLKKLKHTYLPTVLDFLELDGEIYTVMDFVPGRNLAEELKEEKRFPQKLVLKWAIQLSEALAYLHSRNPPIIHSDIKPANIMLTPEGNICLIDFNVSLAFDPGISDSLGISGGYSPPEQYRNRSSYRHLIGTAGSGDPIPATPAWKTAAAQLDQPALTEETELLVETGVSDKTELLVETEASDRTELLVETEALDKTELLVETGVPDKTELLVETGVPDRTEFLVETETSDKTERRVAAGMSAIDVGLTTETETTTETESLAEDFIGGGINLQSDVYSLGATLYHLLTGIRPSYDYSVIKPLGQCGVGVSEGLVSIVEKAMELDPLRRYRDGMEFHSALEHIELLDSRYRSFRKKKRSALLRHTACWALSAALAVSGIWTIRYEREQMYYKAIEAAGDHISRTEYELAADSIAEAQRIMSRRIDACAVEALRLYSMNEYADCLDYCRRVINDSGYPVRTERDRTRFAELWYLAGSAYYELEDFQQSTTCFQTAVKYNPENSVYYRDLAIALAKVGRIDQAKLTLEQAMGKGMNQDSLYLAQGEILMAEQNYGEAETSFLQAIDTARDDQMRSRAYILCARAYRTMGNVDKEIAILERGRGDFSAGAPLNITERLGETYARRANSGGGYRDYQKALDYFQQVSQGGYASYQLMENMAVVTEQMNHLDDAEKILMQMQERYPEEYRVYKRLAFLEGDKQQQKPNASRDYSRAKAYYEKAQSLYGSAGDSDPEMEMLSRMMDELAKGNWL